MTLFLKVGSENKSSTISQISFLKGQRMVFTAAKTAGHTLGFTSKPLLVG